MPRLPERTPVEIVLNPLVSLPNERRGKSSKPTRLGPKNLGMWIATPVFDGVSERKSRNSSRSDYPNRARSPFSRDDRRAVRPEVTGRLYHMMKLYQPRGR